MRDREEMTEDEHRLQDARESAARVYRAANFDAFAEEVENGEHDDCQQMRVARFFIEPPPPITPEFCAAWNEAVTGVK